MEVFSQENKPVDSLFLKANFPETMVIFKDIVYKRVNGIELKLDIYKRSVSDANSPVVVSIHGGAWYAGSKQDDVRYSTKLFNELISKGYAIVSIDYRLSQQAVFPAQIQDCNDAINYIFTHSSIYKLDKNRIAVMGGSAGGHLAALVATMNVHNIPDFYTNGKKPKFSIKGVVDLYGVSDFMACRGNSGYVDHDDPNSAEAKLLGASPLERPDVAKKASPVTYITKDTPPFLIFHGDKDPVVQYSQSVILHSYLQLAGVKNKFITVPGAGHGTAEFGRDEYNEEIISFLSSVLNNKNK